eukprot:11158791-Lingulodinium_polyedra.AAC.1
MKSYGGVGGRTLELGSNSSGVGKAGSPGVGLMVRWGTARGANHLMDRKKVRQSALTAVASSSTIMELTA